MMPHSNAVLLQHPCGANVMLIGTQHVSLSHGSQAGTAVERLQPSRVVLELDEARFQQVDFRLRYLMHADTASLMEMAADPGTSRSFLQMLLPDALLWGQHMKQFSLMRNEGVPLLLGSLYGADFLQAALAASALPEQASLVLADQPQHVTMARFKALTDTLGALRRLMGGVFGTAHAEAHTVHSDIKQQQQQQWQVSLSTPTLSSSSSTGPLEAMQQLQQIFSAAAQLAAGRMIHLFLNWWAMALTSQSRWYGDNIHPVFLLVGDTELQRKLAARGCAGVTEAAAAAGRLLEVAAAAGSSSSNGVLPAVEDLQPVRRFVESLERVMWTDSSSSSSSNSSTRSGSGGSQVMHWLAADPSTAVAAGEARFSELLPLRPWWVTLSETFSNKLTQLSSGAPAPTAAAARVGCEAAAGAGSSLAAALQQHQHANVTAAAAYDQAVMAERNRVLVTAMWQHAAAAAAEEAEVAGYAAQHGSGVLSQEKQQKQQQQQQEHAAVVAVVGYNHVPGIVQLWRQLQQQHAQQTAVSDGHNISSSTSYGQYASADSAAAAAAALPDGAFLPWQVTLTDAVASVLELAAAGGAGLCYWTAVNRAAPAAAAAAGSSSVFARLGAKASSGPGMRRLGLLLLPAAVALLPLQRDAKRLQEAGGLLSKVAVVNDVILGQELRELAGNNRQYDSNKGRDGKQAAGVWQGAGSSIMQMALKATAGAVA